MEINLPEGIGPINGRFMDWEVSVNAVKHELTEYLEKDNKEDVVSTYTESYLGNKKGVTVAGWLRLGSKPKIIQLLE